MIPPGPAIGFSQKTSGSELTEDPGGLVGGNVQLRCHFINRPRLGPPSPRQQQSLEMRHGVDLFEDEVIDVFRAGLLLRLGRIIGAV